MWIQEENYLWNYARGYINEKFSEVFWKSQEVKTRKQKKYLLSIKHHFCRSDIEQHVIKPPLEPGANSLISDYSHSPQQPLLWNILLERRGKAYSQTHRVFTSHWTFLIMKWQKYLASLGTPWQKLQAIFCWMCFRVQTKCCEHTNFLDACEFNVVVVHGNCIQFPFLDILYTSKSTWW